jgi:tetratricopeptide (TPR) repeat protein
MALGAGEGMGFLRSNAELDEKTARKAERHLRAAEKEIGHGRAEGARAELELAAAVLGDRQASKESPDMGGYYMRTASAWRELGDIQEVEAALRRAQSIPSCKDDATLSLADIKIRAGKMEEALRIIEAASPSEPSRPLALKKAEAYERLGRTQEALGVYKKAIAAFPDDLEIINLLIMRDSDRAYWVKRKQIVTGELREVSLTQPSEVRPRPEPPKTAPVGAKESALLAARQKRGQGDKLGAIPFYKDALRSDPQDKEVWCEVASLLGELDRREESAIAFERALSIDPTYAPAAEGRRDALATKIEQVDIELVEAEEAPDKEAPARDEEIPEDRRQVEGLLRMAQDLMSLNRYSEAVRPLRKAAKLAPDRLDILRGIKECFKHLQKDKDVIEMSDRVLRLDPTDKAAALDKAVALDRLGEKEQAVQYYEMALGIDPGNTLAIADLAAALYNMEDFDRALGQATSGLEADPGNVELWHIRGDSLFALRRFEEAAQAYQSVVSFNPEDKGAQFYLGISLEAMRRYPEALAAYDAALRVDPRDPDIWVSKGITLEWMQLYDAALAAYQMASDLRPKDKFIRVRMGVVLARTERHGDAVEQFDIALHLGGKDMEVLQAKKRSQKAMEDNEGLIRTASRIVKLDPGDSQALVDMGAALHALGRFEEAIKAFDKAAVASADKVPILLLRKASVAGAQGDMVAACDTVLACDPMEPTSLIERAAALQGRGDHVAAAKAYGDAISRLGESKDLLGAKGMEEMAIGNHDAAARSFGRAFALDDTAVEMLDAHGRALLFLKEYDKALAAFDRCVNVSKDPRYRVDRGRALASMGRLDEALQDLDKALESDRSDAETWRFKGNAHLKLQQYDRALQAFDRAIGLGAPEGQLLRLKGRALEETHRPEAAADCYERALAMGAEDAPTLERLARVQADLGYLDAAWEAADRAARIDGALLGAWHMRGDLSTKLGREEDALRSFDRVLAISPEDAAAMSGKGMVMLRKGQVDAAIASFERALASDPECQQAKEGMLAAERAREEDSIAEMAGKVLECEHRTGRRLTKEEAYASCEIPFDRLDRVMEYVAAREVVALDSLSSQEASFLDEVSRNVLLAAHQKGRGDGVLLSDVSSAIPKADISASKRVLAYIDAVNQEEAPPPSGEELDPLLRKAMRLPKEERSQLGLMRKLGIGPRKAKGVMAAMDTLKSPQERKGDKAEKPHKRRRAGPEVQDEQGEEEAGPPPPTLERTFNVQPEEPPRGNGQPILFGHSEKELYATFYGQQPQKEKELSDRRCIFHDQPAMSACPACKAVLCHDCVSMGACPRCRAPLRMKPKMSEIDKKEKPTAMEILSAASREEVEIADASEDKDWTRL